MCGIAGIITPINQTANSSELTQMLNSMKHRGPDSQGKTGNNTVKFGMNRLAIVDVSGGDQPFFSEDGKISIVGNGEIYNYPELVSRIKSRHKLSSKSDIEAILHLYEDYGDKCVEKIKGMFAFIIYDQKRQKVLIARDRSGEKPLYYTVINDKFYFASELKSILKIKKINKTLNLSNINNYFHYYYGLEPETMFSEIHKLPAGNYLTIKLTNFQIEITKYWPLDKPFLTLKHPKEEVRSALLKACNRTMMADVPVGIALSGGLDSAAILSCLAKKNRDSLTAFTIGYEKNPPTDERSAAKKLANHFGIKFISHELTDAEVVEKFPMIVKAGDEPIADIAASALDAVSELAHKNGVKVLLTGAGGDELFWGYSWVRQALADHYQQIKNTGNLSQVTFAQNQTSFKGAEQFIKRYISKEFINAAAANPLASSTPPLNHKSELHVARHYFRLMRELWLTPDVLTLGDRLGMAHSIETRAPLLDTDLVDLLRESKQTLLAYKKPHKYWLKQALYDTVPEFVLARKKQGFTPPVGRWIFKILLKHIHLLNDGFLVDQKIVDPISIRMLTTTWLTMPLSWYRIYQLLVLEVWGREYYY
jgi:asparagine synthase (glutamine-hydrolysing)